jgi:hypothetical protein
MFGDSTNSFFVHIDILSQNEPIISFFIYKTKMMPYLKPVLIITLFFFSSNILFGDDKAYEKYYGYTPEEILKLPDKVRSAELPMIFGWAASQATSPFGELTYKQELNSLMYSGFQNYSEAVKSFQKDLGDQPTGILTVGQIDKLGKYSEHQKLGWISFPYTFSSLKNDITGYAKVTGTFVMYNENIAFPVNYVEIVCDKREGYCNLKQTVLIIPKEDDFSMTYSVMNMAPERYKIISWEGDEINAVYDSPDSGLYLLLNFKKKEFIQYNKNKKRTSQIMDGKNIFNESFDRVAKTSFSYLSSEYRNAVYKLIEESERQSKKKGK